MVKLSRKYVRKKLELQMLLATLCGMQEGEQVSQDLQHWDPLDLTSVKKALLQIETNCTV